MDNFGFCYNVEKARVSKDDFSIFSKTWFLFDENSSGSFPISRLHSFIFILDGSLGERNNLHVRRLVYQTRREMRINARRLIAKRKTRIGGRLLGKKRVVEIPEDECEFYTVLRLLCLHKLGDGSLTSRRERERYLRDYDECMQKAACDFIGLVWKRFKNRAPSTAASSVKETAEPNDSHGERMNNAIDEKKADDLKLKKEEEEKEVSDGVLAVLKRREEIRRLQSVVFARVASNPLI